MSTINRYILKQLVIALVFSTTALMGMLWLLNSLKFFDDFFEKSLSFGVFIKMTALLMPGFLTIFLPIALFGVVLFVYNRLSLDRELMVLQSAGLSGLQIGWPALLLSLAGMVFCFYLTLFAVPKLERDFNQLNFEIRHEIGRSSLEEGAFTEMSDGLTVYVRAFAPNGDLQDLLIHDDTNAEVEVTITARRGALTEDGGATRIVMVNGVRQERDRQTGRVSFLYFDSQSIPLDDREASEAIRVPKSRERPLRELFTLEVGDQMAPGRPEIFNAGAVRRMRMEGHQRLSKPLAAVSFVLLALGTLMTGNFDRQNRQGRVIAAAALVVLAQGGDIGIASLARSDSVFMPFLYASPLVTGGLGLWWLLRRPPRPSPPRTRADQPLEASA
jgi:lipopolysaccharide export system permease protein